MKYLKKFNEFFKQKLINKEQIINLIDYSDCYDLYPDYSEDYDNYEPDYSTHNQNQCKFRSKEDFDNFIKRIMCFNDFPEIINIYRSLRLNNISDLNYNNIGECWSWNKNTAIRFGDKIGDCNYILSAKIKHDDVNWDESIKRYTQWSLYTTEDELTIYPKKVYDITIEKM